MSDMDVDVQQEEILNRVCHAPQTESGKEATGILSAIRDYQADTIQYAMGDFGERLKLFAEVIDLSHPDLAELYGGQLIGLDNNFSRDASDVLKLAAYAKDASLSANVLENLRRVIYKHDFFQCLNRAINSPVKNQLHVRFVKDESLRREIRQSKKYQVVGLGNLYKKGLPYWITAGDSFEPYYRNSSLFQKDINEAKTRKAHFVQFGLSAMAGEIQSSIEEMEVKEKQNYYCGFNKISLSLASIILGKICGYEFSDSGSDTVMAFAKPSHFKKYQFFDDEVRDDNFWFNRLEYYPRAYTFEELRSMASEGMIRLVNFLDAYPAMSGKPLFDHYRVLIPGINYPNSLQGKPFHFKKNGVVQEYETTAEAQVALDREMLSVKAVTGILLGERDGDHYFIAFWN